MLFRVVIRLIGCTFMVIIVIVIVLIIFNETILNCVLLIISVLMTLNAC